VSVIEDGHDREAAADGIFLVVIVCIVLMGEPGKDVGVARILAAVQLPLGGLTMVKSPPAPICQITLPSPLPLA
jgi:hypothetical protein